MQLDSEDIDAYGLVESEGSDWDHSQIGSYSSEFKLENKCHRENIENTYLVPLVTLCLHTILFVYIIVNVCKQSLISWG